MDDELASDEDFLPGNGIETSLASKADVKKCIEIGLTSRTNVENDIETDPSSKITGKTALPTEKKSKKKTKYNCERCDFVTDHSGHYRKHVRRHDGSRPATCDICSKSFIEVDDLQRHRRRVHETTVRCSICDVEFKTQVKVKVHMRQVHSINCEMKSCEHCSLR